MDPSRNGKNRAPLGDVTNTTTQGNHDTVGQRPEEEDPKARKRRMDRERYASMSAEKRNEQNRRRRERRMEKKVRIDESEPTEKGDQDNDYQDIDDMQPYKETPVGSEIISQQPDEADETDYMNIDGSEIISQQPDEAEETGYMNIGTGADDDEGLSILTEHSAMISNRLWILSDLHRHPNYRKKPSAWSLAQAIGGWEIMDYDHNRCRFTLLPWEFNRNFMLYVIDHKSKNITIICTQPIRDCFKDEPWKQYILRMVDIIQMYRSAMRVHQPGWEEHLFEWKHIIADGIPKNIPRHLTGYIILQYMTSIHNAKATPICTDGKTMRQNFLIDILWSRGNAYRTRLPKGVQDYLTRITGKSL